MNEYSGIVGRGGKHAAALGFPTVNIPLTDASVSGIYVACVKVGEEEYEAVAYADKKRGVLEAHILDFSKDLYGWNITIRLLKKIRERENFANETALKKAIVSDVSAALEYFKRRV